MVDYRPLSVADLASLRRLRRALWPDDTDDYLDAQLAELFAGERRITYGAFTAGEMIGFVEGAVRDWGDGCDTFPVGWVEGLFVDPAHRRTGIGRHLVDLVAEWARAKGIRELGSDILVGNDVSLAAHLVWGFEETERVIMLRRRL